MKPSDFSGPARAGLPPSRLGLRAALRRPPRRAPQGPRREADWLEQARQARIGGMGQLALSIAHEVQQPLAAATLHARVALRSLDRPEADLVQVEAALRMALLACEQANAIVLAIRQLAAHAPVARPAPSRLDAALRDMLPLLNGELQEHRIELVLALCPLAHSVLADPVQLRQVLFNLIANAIAALRDVGERPRELSIVSRRIDEAGAALRISVSDNGAGVPAADSERIFAPLYTTTAGGMGMGLHLCRSIVEAHGGRIWTSPGQPHGSTFHFTLPVAGVDRAAP